MWGVVLVTGGRDYADRARVFSTLDRLDARMEVLAVRHGGATGADALADEWARTRGIRREPYPVTHEEWRWHGPSAGPIRNGRMVCTDPRPVCVVAFPGGRGTADCVRQARRHGIPVWEIVG